MPLLSTVTLLVVCALPNPAPGSLAETLPAPRSLLPPPTIVPSPMAPAILTKEEFAATFQPTPGQHDVVLLNPFTHKPVQVRFWLPPGVTRVYAGRHAVYFDSPRWSIEIWFRPLGGAEVRKIFPPAVIDD